MLFCQESRASALWVQQTGSCYQQVPVTLFMKASDRQKLAEELISEATELGLTATNKGHWVSFTPAPPIGFITRAAQCGDELARIVAAKEQNDAAFGK